MSKIQNVAADREALLARMLNATGFPVHVCILFLCVVLGLKNASNALFNARDFSMALFVIESLLVTSIAAIIVYLGVVSARASIPTSSGEYDVKDAVDKVATASRGNKRVNRTHNFSAGPSCIFEEVLNKAQDEFQDYQGLGMNFMECSHRDVDGPVQTVLKKLVANMRELLKVPDNYHVLFFQGGAHAQFSAVPMNLIGGVDKPKADFVDTGIWSKKAMAEHSKWCECNVVYNAEDDNETTIRPVSEWNLSEDAEYVHCTTNETMTGLEFLVDPDVGDKILCADMTSTLLSRPVDISKYGVIYASSGKNLGPAGAACVIVRDDLLDKALPGCPGIISYKNQAKSVPIPNIYNTPPTYILYLINLTLEHMKSEFGTLENIEKRCIKRAGMVYDLIDNSDGFYVNNVDPTYRSRMNCVFRIKEGDRKLEDLFTKESAAQGLEQLFGHPLMGGNRITLYNAIHDESVDKVVKFMKDFMEKYR